MKQEEQAEVGIQIPPMQIKMFEITLIGDSPLIMHKWSEKAKKQMLDKQMKKAKPGREAKDPQQDYEESIYRDADGKIGFPSTAFKNAAVDAAVVAGLHKTTTRGAFHIEGDLVPIKGKPRMREDMVRINRGLTADIRYRAEFVEWETTFRIRYNAAALSMEQIVQLFSTAGFAVGVGEHRPQKNGSFGMFSVKKL